MLNLTISELLRVLSDCLIYCEYCKPPGFKKNKGAVCAECGQDTLLWVTLNYLREAARNIRNAHREIRSEAPAPLRCGLCGEEGHCA